MLAASLGLSVTSFAQSGKSPSSRIRCQSVKLQTNGNRDSLAIPLSKIIIRDVRSDSSKFGLFKSPLDPELYKFCFADGGQVQLTHFANQYLSGNLSAASDQQVLMCIRRLWLTTDDTIVNRLTYVPRTKAVCRAEFYLATGGSYYALYRYDSAIVAEGKLRLASAKQIEQILSAALDRLKSIDYAAIPVSKRKISPEAINQYYDQSKSFPVNTQVSKGVFETFADFKQNKPSHTSFDIRFESMADMLYVKDEKGQEYVNRTAWGFSDGERVFIRYGNNFFRLHKQQDTWEFYGTERLTADYWGHLTPRFQEVPTGQGGALPNNKVKLGKLEFYQLDMENGQFIN